MTEPTYLWNWYCTRRHIQRPGPPFYTGTTTTMCGGFHNPREVAETNIRRFARYDSLATAQVPTKIAKLDTVPVCKLCERAWAKLQEPTP